MRHVVICGLSGSTKFSHIPHEEFDFFLKKEVIDNNMFGSTFCKNFAWNVTYSKKNGARYD
jgi:hypothetical protein